ncbi:MAG: hypothetical protein U0X20_29310 [Caldilineaceae bacterium]
MHQVQALEGYGEGAQAMIDEGFYREAMYWIWTYLAVANNADPAARAPRLAAAQQLAAEVAAAARRIVDRHPQIAA